MLPKHITHPSIGTLRQFGLISSAILIVWSIYQHTTASTNSVTTFSVGILISLVTIGLPSAIRPIYTACILITFPIGWIISTALLAAIFFGLIWPIGIIRRSRSQGPLGLKHEQSKQWQRVNQPTTMASYFRQF